MNFHQIILNRKAKISITSTWAKCNKMLCLQMKTVFHWSLVELEKTYKTCHDYHLYTESFGFQTIFYSLDYFFDQQHQNVRHYCQLSLKLSFWAISLRTDDEYWQELFELDVLIKKYKPEVQLAFKCFKQWSVSESGYFWSSAEVIEEVQVVQWQNCTSENN